MLSFGIQHMAHAVQVANTEYRAQRICLQVSHELRGSGSARFSHVEVKVRHDYAKVRLSPEAQAWRHVLRPSPDSSDGHDPTFDSRFKPSL